MQVPAAPGSAHDSQVPLQSLLQQTPCAQIRLLQSSLAVHGAPSGLRPQLPLAQKLPALQSALLWQIVKQSLPAGLH